MKINKDPLSNREATRPPTPQERAAMRATRDRVRTDEVSRQEIASRRIESARTEAKQEEKKDRIEISVEARRRTEATQADQATRRERLQRLKGAYQNGELGTKARRRAAADGLLGRDKS